MTTLPAPPESLPDFPSDPVVRALVLDTYEWVRGWTDASDPKVAPLSIVASVYAWFCSPSHPTERQLRLAARFTLLFFLVDDAEMGELESLVGDADGVRVFQIGALTPALDAWLADLGRSVVVSPTLLERLGRTHSDYLLARRTEGSAAAPANIEAHWALRRRTIFMDPYLDHWMILREMDASPLQRADLARGRQLAIDIVLISNDLGSVARDREGGASPDDLNLVHALMSSRAIDASTAIAQTIARHNEWVVELRERVAALEDSSTAPYLDLLVGVTDGNLESLRALKARYPGVDDVLRQLLSVRPRAPQHA